MKKALITGITGQTGSFLAELLLEKGYEVHGMVRRTSQPLMDNIKDIVDKIHLHNGDMTDAGSIYGIIEKVMPDEIYNLAGMSQVRWSYDVPAMTMDVNCSGFLRVIESVRGLGLDCKIYQAGSSEMFGKVQETPQTEKTPFYPRSPYGVSKLASVNMARVYREGYGMKIYCGILFNHECISHNNPLVVKENGFIKIKRPIDIRKPKTKGANKQHWVFDELDIWDGSEFVSMKCMTATKRPNDNVDFKVRLTNTRNGIIETTNHHNLINELGEKVKTDTTDIGDTLLHGIMPSPLLGTKITNEEAELMGLLVSDGWVGREVQKGSFANNNSEILNRLGYLWNTVSMGYISEPDEVKTYFGTSTRVKLNGNSIYLGVLRERMYTFDGFKKVPDVILNSSKEVMNSFLVGYNAGDGLKANKCTYLFKNFKTNSSVLATGLIYLIKNTTNQSFNITFESDEKYYGYYSINFHSPKHDKRNIIKEELSKGNSQRYISKKYSLCRNTIRKHLSGEDIYKDHILLLSANEIKKTIYHESQPEWVFDIETGSKKFMCGAGLLIISNSEKRGEEFLSRKVCKAVAEIAAGEREKLVLGNLDSKRDWGYAKEYCNWIHAIVQHPTPDDFVIATGETHSVKEFVELAFKHAGIDNWEAYVEYDQSLTRPAEVDLLLGDASKSKEVLGFEPKVKFNELVKIMVDAEMKKFL